MNVLMNNRNENVDVDMKLPVRRAHTAREENFHSFPIYIPFIIFSSPISNLTDVPLVAKIMACKFFSFSSFR